MFKAPRHSPSFVPAARPPHALVWLTAAALLGAPTLLAQAGAPDPASASVRPAGFTVADRQIRAEGKFADGRFGGLRIFDPAAQRGVTLAELFTLILPDGSQLRSSSLPLAGAPRASQLVPAPTAARYAERLHGQQVCMTFSVAKPQLRVDWCGVLRDGSNYFRQRVTLRPLHRPLAVTTVELLRLSDPQARVTGTVPGSPAVDATMFFSVESPLSHTVVQNGTVTSSLSRALPLQPGQAVTYSSVVGVAAPSQMRRSFLRYIERERAHPYRPFLQYNSWYDLGANNRYGEKGALDRIHAFGTELTEMRGARVRSFVFDDGWDNPASLWKFDSGFPNGFTPASQETAKFHSHIGVWMSPWGGYDKQKLQRIAYGRRRGFEIVKGGFALSGPKYYAAFEQTCLNMIRQYGANEFKFDGTGNANRVVPGSHFDSDFDAMLALIRRLRQTEPDIFINLTTGTYASPYWLFDSDAIWRGGEDHSFAGAGTSRQRWITYRDSQVYKNEVQAGPLFPLNSLMLHGMIYAKLAEGLDSDPQHDFRDEVESFFGSGTQVQEMYMTPSLLWSLANADTLKDSHWIGGDPAQLAVYGWASWSPAKGIVVLRNPSDKPQEYSLDIGRAWELPAFAPRVYTAHDPWDSTAPQQRLTAGHAVTLHLKPWQVITLEASPVPQR
jgi:hypothetical protein